MSLLTEGVRDRRAVRVDGREMVLISVSTNKVWGSEGGGEGSAAQAAAKSNSNRSAIMIEEILQILFTSTRTML